MHAARQALGCSAAMLTACLRAENRGLRAERARTGADRIGVVMR